jgi:hypothetical protein
LENLSTSDSNENYPSKPEWTALKVAHIATGDPEKDKQLAEEARREGYTVLIDGSSTESDPIFNNFAKSISKATPIQSVPTRDLSPFAVFLKKLNRVIFRDRTKTEIIVNLFAAIALMITGHLLLSFFTYDRIAFGIDQLLLEENFFYFLLGGFIAQMILWGHRHYFPPVTRNPTFRRKRECAYF